MTATTVKSNVVQFRDRNGQPVEVPALPGDDQGQLQPHDFPAEQAVLGGMLLSKDAIKDVLDVIRKSRIFYRPAHQIVFEVVYDLYTDRRPTDTISVAAELGRRNLLERAGGASYLHTLIASVPTAANAGHYARRIVEMARWRAMCEASASIGQIARKTLGDIDAAWDGANRVFADAMSLGADAAAPDDEDAAGWMELYEQAHEGTADVGITTGLVDLDKMIRGLRPGNMMVIGARPAVGKSALATTLTRHFAIELGVPVGIVSTEMARRDVRLRMLAGEACIDVGRLEAGRLDGGDLERHDRAFPVVSSAPVTVLDADTSITALAAKCRRLHARGKLRVLVVDYLQQLEPARKVNTRYESVTEVSRALKLLALELDIVVIAVSQLNRGSESRAERRPEMHDLRESGQLEQDADKIILMYREAMHNPTDLNAGVTELIVAKHRNGPTGTVTVQFQGEFVRFVNSTVYPSRP